MPGEPKFLGNLTGTSPAFYYLLTKPIGRAQKFTGEDVGLDFLPLSRRITLRYCSPGLDLITTQPGRQHSDILAGIAMEFEVSDLVRNDDSLILD
jgi:hypothetical protein